MTWKRKGKIDDPCMSFFGKVSSRFTNLEVPLSPKSWGASAHVWAKLKIFFPISNLQAKSMWKKKAMSMFGWISVGDLGLTDLCFCHWCQRFWPYNSSYNSVIYVFQGFHMCISRHFYFLLGGSYFGFLLRKHILFFPPATWFSRISITVWLDS